MLTVLLNLVKRRASGVTARVYHTVTPSGVRGVARILDVGTTMRIHSYRHELTCSMELMDDWNSIGRDMEAAIEFVQRDIERTAGVETLGRIREEIDRASHPDQLALELEPSGR